MVLFNDLIKRRKLIVNQLNTIKIKLNLETNKDFPKCIMTDINDVMPKIPSMKWGALMNRAPTNSKVEELNRIFPHNGKWHTVFEEKDHTYIDDKLIWKKDKKAWT